MIKLLAVIPLSLVFTASTLADTHDDKAAILAVLDKAFDAVASQKVSDWQAIEHPEGVKFSFRANDEGQQILRLSTNASDYDREPTDDDYSENWIGEPTVMIRGPLASVWGEYEFWLNGKRNHCGIDTVQLGKIDGQWTIINFAWTVEPDNCPE